MSNEDILQKKKNGNDVAVNYFMFSSASEVCHPRCVLKDYW